MSNTTPTEEIALTESHIDFLRAAGASSAFVEVVQKTTCELPSTVGRNSARLEVQKYIKWGDLTGSPEGFTPLGGHFFTALWEGDLYDAFTRADLANRKILLTLFSETEIDDHRPDPIYPTVALLEGRA